MSPSLYNIITPSTMLLASSAFFHSGGARARQPPRSAARQHQKISNPKVDINQETTADMSSQDAVTPAPIPAPPALAIALAPALTEIKEEESATTPTVTALTTITTTALENATENATQTSNENATLQPPVTTESLTLPSAVAAPTPIPTSNAPVPAAELTKKDYDVMARIVKYLTEYKDEEYGSPIPPLIELEPSS